MTTKHAQQKKTLPGGIRRTLATAITLALIAVTALSATPAAEAQDHEVIADGLNGPQGVLVGPDGDVWVIDTGLGGDQSIDVLDTESGEMVEATFGMSAQIVRVDPATGEQDAVASLPSIATPSGGYGGGRLTMHDDVMFASIGEWATPDAERPAGLSTIATVDSDGSVTTVADTWRHEADIDPYPRGGSHSHPYGMATAADGRLLYADAGGNALLAVNTATGAIETVAVFEPLPGVFPRPDYDGEMLTDPVPTSVVVHAGRTFVSLLSGAPFAPGSAKVVEVHDDGSVTDWATGLTMLTDLRKGPDGNLYATTFAEFGEEGPAPASGSVSRIRPDGSTEVVVDGLSFVTSIDFDSEGNAYIATNGVGPPGSGQVLRVAQLAIPLGDEVLAWTGTNTNTLAASAFALIASGLLLARSGRLMREITDDPRPRMR